MSLLAVGYVTQTANNGCIVTREWSTQGDLLTDCGYDVANVCPVLNPLSIWGQGLRRLGQGIYQNQHTLTESVSLGVPVVGSVRELRLSCLL